MEGIRSFLESSTVHGLSYISSTRKYARFFWIVVVLAGFSTAGYLIYQSFQSWADSPVKTTVETLPISEITFPKITVCPPRNTFTDLNYDLMLVENVSLTEAVTQAEDDTEKTVEFDYFGIPIGGTAIINTRNDELLEFASEVIDDHLYLDNWMWLEEENRFYNWYQGYTRISEPKYDQNGILEYEIDTSAISGVVSTKHFGEKFNYQLFLKNLKCQIYINTPKNLINNGNVTLYVNLERAPISRDSKSIQEKILVQYKPISRDDDQTVVLYKFSSPSPGRSYIIDYVFNAINAEKADFGERKLMPGFRVKWWYTGLGVLPDRTFSSKQKTKNLRR